MHADGQHSRYRICPLNPADAARLGVGSGEIVELVGGAGPALRAWSRIDPAVMAGTVPLDKIGQAITATIAGKALYIRRLRHRAVS